MAIAFISDIHGNYEALQAVLAELDRLAIVDVYCVGDTAGYHTQINECCDELRRRAIPSVMGNHDWYLAGGGFCSRSKSVNTCIAYQRRVITEPNLAWMRGLPVHLQIGEVQMVHGGWTDPIDEYLVPSAGYFDRVEGRTFVSGHTHVPTIQKFPGGTYCNPGSVGQPRDGDPRAAFAVYDGENFELRRVQYNMERVFLLMEAAGFSDYFYGGLKTGAPNLRRLAD
jgi:predicted phosphodiesterase